MSPASNLRVFLLLETNSAPSSSIPIALPLISPFGVDILTLFPKVDDLFSHSFLTPQRLFVIVLLYSRSSSDRNAWRSIMGSAFDFLPTSVVTPFLEPLILLDMLLGRTLKLIPTPITR